MREPEKEREHGGKGRGRESSSVLPASTEPYKGLDFRTYELLTCAETESDTNLTEPPRPPQKTSIFLLLLDKQHLSLSYKTPSVLHQPREKVELLSTAHIALWE